MHRTITMPKCPYCKEELKYEMGDYNTSKIVELATGTGSDDVMVKCKNCEKDYRVTCNIRYYGRK